MTGTAPPRSGEGFRNLIDSPSMAAIGRFASMGITLVATPFIARALGPSGRGVTSAILAIQVLLPVAVGLGVPLAIGRRVAAEGLTRDLVHTGRVLVGLSILPCAGLSILIHALVFGFMTQQQAIAYYTLMSTVPMTLSWAIDASIMVATHQFRRLGLLSAIQAMVATTLVLLCYQLSSLNVESVLYANAAGQFTTFAFGRYWIKSSGGRVSDMASIIREAASLAGGQLADVSSKRIDQVIALPLLGAAGAGYYSVAATVGGLAAPAAQAFANAAFRGLTLGDQEQTNRAVRQSAAISVVAALALSGLGWLGIPMVFGEDFLASRPVAAITVLGSAFSGVGYLCALALAARRQGRKMTVSLVLGLAVGLSLMVAGAQCAGPVGAAAGMSVGALVSMLLSLRLLEVPLRMVVPRWQDITDSFRVLFGAAK